MWGATAPRDSKGLNREAHTTAVLSDCPTSGPSRVLLREQQPYRGLLAHCKEEARILMLSGIWHLSQRGVLPGGSAGSHACPLSLLADSIIINMLVLSVASETLGGKYSVLMV